MKKIKWENIVFIIMLCYGIVSIYLHLSNKINPLSFTEVPYYLILAIMSKLSVKYIRKNMKQIKQDFKMLFIEK